MSVLAKVSLLALACCLLAILVNAQKPLPCDGIEVGMPRIDRCVNRCPGTCGGGTCNATNHCNCRPGFRASGRNLICTPNCISASCQSSGGVCIAVDFCQCSQPSLVYDDTLKSCVSRGVDPCSGNCLKGRCQPDGTCVCPTDYRNIGGVPTAECEPICPVLPENSACIMPELASCNDGFSQKLDSTTCTPVA